MKWLWLILCVAGAVVPYYFLLPFLFEYGLDLGRLIQLATTNTVAPAFLADLLIACVVFWIWVYRERPSRMWIIVPATLLVGLSFALPLYLYLRESKTAVV